MAGARVDVLSQLIARGQGRFASIVDRNTATAAQGIREAQQVALDNVRSRQRAITSGADLPPARPSVPGTAERIQRAVEESPQILRQNSIRPAGLGDNLDVLA